MTPAMPATNGVTGPTPLHGLWQPRLNLKNLYYGSGCVQRYLIETLPSVGSRVVVTTGKSLATGTRLVSELEQLLGSHHIGTISNIRQHGPQADVDAAVDTILEAGKNGGVDTIISLGGGSPIDTAKVISLRVKEKLGHFLCHITIPTTLSAAECTAGGGFTKLNGVKVGFRDPGMGVNTIFYDPHFASATPKQLWLSTGMRAMDHAVECMYHSSAAEVPWRALAHWAVGELFECLPRARDTHPHDQETVLRLMLAAFASSGLKGENIPGGMGLSHSLGHALGSPYGIPHGITSCMTLGKVVQLKVKQSQENAAMVARLSTAIGSPRTGNDVQDGLEVGQRIAALANSLGLDVRPLSGYGVSREETNVIVTRALGGSPDHPDFGVVRQLVDSLF